MADEFTSQFFFNDTPTDSVYTQSPYSSRGSRDPRNGSDGIYNSRSTEEAMNIRQIPQSARRLALAAVVVGSIALAPSAGAQGQDPPRQGPPAGERLDPRQVIDQRMARMTETLKLDSIQQDKIRSILADETMDMEALRKNAGGQRAGGGGQRGGRGGGRGGGRRGSAPPDSTGGGEDRGGSGGQSPEVRAIIDRTNKQIEGVLNAQQLMTYRQLFEQQPQQRTERSSS